MHTDYAHRSLDAQPQRSRVHGFITNTKRRVLIRGVREPTSPFGVYLVITAPLQFAEDMPLFFHYLQNDNAFVRPLTVQGSALVIEHGLRPGGSCRAFTARRREQQVVAKLYKSGEKAAEDAIRITQAHQIYNAATLSQPCAQVPSVVATGGVSFCLHLLELILRKEP